MKARLLESTCVVDEQGRVSNLQGSLTRGLAVCEKLPERKGSLAIVGSGPSVWDYLDELRGAEVWAINGAYDFLLSQGITPAGFVGIDPLPGLAEYVKNAKLETTFYLASTCDPLVFDALSDQQVKLWHPECEGMDYPIGQYIVGGGTTALTRAPFLAHMMGWRDMTLYGADSSFTDQQYCYRWGTYGCDIDQPIIKVTLDGKTVFDTEVGLAKQVAQLGFMLTSFNGILKFRCGGLMDAFLKAPMMNDAEIEIDRADAA